ncbi:unnamed protein product [Didymodactylos carnosus]|uniref:Uncharacterized protein n=1 Tax=Didymodactylos carnosus TaxID=1234261 RepID=A0A816ELW5_9BILA|nr:unnamed protein product [Didymodactylos carnosus]CAF4571684.1 unnamed protein product [Didymodactylos carnosus]
MLPSRYTQAVMTGESAAGLIASSVRILTKLFMSNNHLSTITFYLIGIVFILSCLIIYVLIQRTSFIGYYVKICEDAKKIEEIEFQTTFKKTRRHSSLDEVKLKLIE